MAPTGTGPSHKTAAASIKGKSAMVDTMPQRVAAAAERAHADGGDETANERGRSVAYMYSHALKRQQVTIAPHKSHAPAQYACRVAHRKQQPPTSRNHQAGRPLQHSGARSTQQSLQRLALGI